MFVVDQSYFRAGRPGDGETSGPPIVWSKRIIVMEGHYVVLEGKFKLKI